MQSWQSPHGRQLPAIGQRTLIMGILNATPDSFSDGGELPTKEAVVDRAGQMIAAGADILDVGGESTRPGARPISADEELARVLPALAALRRAWPDVPISIDTYKAAVADAAIENGADIVNDIWGLTHELASEERMQWRNFVRRQTEATTNATPIAPPPITKMAGLIARRGCPVILMHNRPDRNYGDFWDDIILDLKVGLALTRAAGIEQSQVWLDPGFGFAKSMPQNLEVLRQLGRIVALGYPVLVGTSRKSTIGTILGAAVGDRLEGNGATVVWAIQQGCRMIRVHDVREMARFARTADAIKAGLGYSVS